MLMNARSVNRQIDCGLITRKRNCRAAPPVLCTMQLCGGRSRANRPQRRGNRHCRADREIGEGILEWIQVSRDYRGCGLGRYIVSELLWRMKDTADFATASGQCHNPNNPKVLYRLMETEYRRAQFCMRIGQPTPWKMQCTLPKPQRMQGLKKNVQLSAVKPFMHGERFCPIPATLMVQN